MAAHNRNFNNKTHNKITISCMISGFCPSVNDICTFLGCYAALISN